MPKIRKILDREAVAEVEMEEEVVVAEVNLPANKKAVGALLKLISSKCIWTLQTVRKKKIPIQTVRKEKIPPAPATILS